MEHLHILSVIKFIINTEITLETSYLERKPQTC